MTKITKSTSRASTALTIAVVMCAPQGKSRVRPTAQFPERKRRARTHTFRISMRIYATWASLIMLRAQPGTGDRVQAHVKSSAVSGASEELQRFSRLWGGLFAYCLPFFGFERLYHGTGTIERPGRGDRPLCVEETREGGGSAVGRRDTETRGGGLRLRARDR